MRTERFGIEVATAHRMIEAGPIVGRFPTILLLIEMFYKITSAAQTSILSIAHADNAIE